MEADLVEKRLASKQAELRECTFHPTRDQTVRQNSPI